MAEPDNAQSPDEPITTAELLAGLASTEPALTSLVDIHRDGLAQLGEGAAAEMLMETLVVGTHPAQVVGLLACAVRRLAAAGLTFADHDQDYFGNVHVDADDRITFVPIVPTGRYQLRQLAEPTGAWVLLPQPEPERPYRVVDRFGRGWLTCHELASTYPSIDGEWTYERIVAERGPVRPVVGPRTADVDRMIDALARAGRKACASVLLALHQVAAACYERDGHDELLVAGRPGSWESAMLPRLAFEVGASIPPGRVDAAAVAVVHDVLRCWIFGETGYVEVAEHLASVFGRVVDGRGGWDEVTDQWLRNGLYGEEVYGLLGSQSRYHGPGGSI